LGWEKPYTVRYASNLDDGPFHGMPLGGFGAGCVGRSHQGDFNLWHIDGGEHVFQTIPGCQFSVFEQSSDEPRAYALSTEPAPDGTLSAWNGYPAASEAGGLEGTRPLDAYHALYPRSWFEYRQQFRAHLTCEQFSPILPHNYQETSYPVAVFAWTAHNPTDAPLTLSIMLSWQNLVGWFRNTVAVPEVVVRDDGSPVYDYQPPLGDSVGNFAEWVQDGNLMGCVMGRKRRAGAPQEGEGEWAIATHNLPGTEFFYHTRWNPAGDGADLWQTFATNGSLANHHDPTPATEGEQVGSAIALRFTLAAGETRQIPFVLSWDFPVTEFAQGIRAFRRYTDFFDREGINSWAIAQQALLYWQDWQQQIQAWQQPILDRTDLSDAIKMALFNELYDLTDGATLWSAASPADPIGQFAVVECLDYRWYESLDVRLYGSFGLLRLFPELEKAVMRAFARAIPTEDLRLRKIGYYFTQGQTSPDVPRKLANATPHDLGAPNEHPWEQTNYTSYQDCNLWKDLGSDFVLLVYRDFVKTGSTDLEFLADCWPAVVAALDYLKTFDLDNDGIPENSGAPDQTFDDWRMQGISSYCGGLWIAALEAALAIAHHLAPSPNLSPSPAAPLERWHTWLAQARALYHNALWNGQYYRLDTGSGSDVVMADQLCGQFYARLLALPDVVPADCAATALRTVYDTCFRNFHNGQFGAANGLRPDGSPVNPNDTHPLEVWTGINFGLAAFLVQMDMRPEAITLTEAVIHQIYDNGLQFRTPEAITSVATFRASHYLRAMAIWAVYDALQAPEASALA